MILKADSKSDRSCLLVATHKAFSAVRSIWARKKTLEFIPGPQILERCTYCNRSVVREAPEPIVAPMTAPSYRGDRIQVTASFAVDCCAKSPVPGLVKSSTVGQMADPPSCTCLDHYDGVMKTLTASRLPDSQVYA